MNITWISRVLRVPLVAALLVAVFSAATAHAVGTFVLGGSSTASITANAVCNVGGGVCNATLTTSVGTRMPTSMTISNLYAFQSTLPASGSTCTFTIRKSAACTAAYASTGITCSINSSTKTCQNTSNTALVAAGDCLQLQFTEVGTCSGYINWGIQGDIP